ncbi:hypothetical protein HZH66_002248 [Vespula vulgaris]|uniref:Uncharacterized protein n=1 Tax=Vespula vulgaris TaxID=7454 RepID=A0A834KKT5_VESVU|nr:hypothetical protein HZH66_002248 [Vespula vulgaris]
MNVVLRFDDDLIERLKIQLGILWSIKFRECWNKIENKGKRGKETKRTRWRGPSDASGRAAAAAVAAAAAATVLDGGSTVNGSGAGDADYVPPCIFSRGFRRGGDGGEVIRGGLADRLPHPHPYAT